MVVDAWLCFFVLVMWLFFLWWYLLFGGWFWIVGGLFVASVTCVTWLVILLAFGLSLRWVVCGYVLLVCSFARWGVFIDCFYTFLLVLMNLCLVVACWICVLCCVFHGLSWLVFLLDFILLRLLCVWSWFTFVCVFVWILVFDGLLLSFWFDLISEFCFCFVVDGCASLILIVWFGFAYFLLWPGGFAWFYLLDLLNIDLLVGFACFRFGVRCFLFVLFDLCVAVVDIWSLVWLF